LRPGRGKTFLDQLAGPVIRPAASVCPLPDVAHAGFGPVLPAVPLSQADHRVCAAMFVGNHLWFLRSWLNREMPAQRPPPTRSFKDLLLLGPRAWPVAGSGINFHIAEFPLPAPHLASRTAIVQKFARVFLETKAELSNFFPPRQLRCRGFFPPVSFYAQTPEKMRREGPHAASDLGFVFIWIWCWF